MTQQNQPKNNKYNKTFKGIADSMEFLMALGRALFNSGRTPEQVLSPMAQPVQQTEPLPEQPKLTEGKFARKTYYTPGETPAYEGVGMLTATGTKPKPGYTVAVSPDMLKSHGGSLRTGDLLDIAGKTYRVEDLTHPDIKGTVDVYMEEVPFGTKGLEKDVPFKVIGRDKEGLRYNISED